MTRSRHAGGAGIDRGWHHCLFAGLILTSFSARAEVVLPGGGTVQAVGGKFSLPHTLGGSSQVGANLFHSFEKLNLAAGETAAFTGPSGIANVLARVTGEKSIINGKIQSDIPGANFYLINPRGVMFGQSAEIDVKGAFTVTTADYVKLEDGGRFDVTNPAMDQLTSAPVSAFGFLSAPQAIHIQGSTTTGTSGTPGNPAVKGGFSAIGGKIILGGVDEANGQAVSIVTKAGDVVIASAASKGELKPDGSAMRGRQPVKMGDVTMYGLDDGNRATIDASGSKGGAVTIRAGRLTAKNATVKSLTKGTERGGAMNLRLKNSLVLKGNASFQTTTNNATTAGRVHASARNIVINSNSDLGSFVDGSTPTSHAGDVVIRAGRLVITDRSSIRSDVQLDAAGVNGLGHGGHVDARADTIEIIGSKTGAESFTGISSRALSSEADSSRGVTVNAQAIRITQGGSISADSGGKGPGGSVNVTANSIFISANGAETETSIRADSLGIAGGGGSPGRGGNVNVNAGLLRIENGGLISTKTTGAGAGGNTTVRADVIEIDRRSSPTNTGIAADSTGIGTGPGGDVFVTADQIHIRGGGQVSASTEGDKPGGDVTVHARSITLAGVYPGAAGKAPAYSRIVSESLQEGPGGRGGNVSVFADTIRGFDDGRISAATNGGGASGNVLVIARDGFFSGKGGGDFTGITATSTSLTQPGAGGGIRAEFGSLTLADGAGIRADTSGPGRGGSVVVRAHDLALENGAFIVASSTGSGVAGSVDVAVDAPLTLDSGSFISSTSAISDAGSVEVASGSGIFITGSSITVSATQGNAGRIALIAPETISLRLATVLAEAGLNGGDVFIDPQFVLLEDSRISANAILGRGGNINIITGVFLASDSAVTASSEASVQGTVRIETLQGDISGALLTLGSSFVSPKTNLAERCAMRLEGDVSTFLLVGRGGVASAPDEAATAIPAPSKIPAER